MSISQSVKGANLEVFELKAESSTDAVFSAPAFRADEESAEIIGNLLGLLGKITGHKPTLLAEGTKETAEGIVLAIASDFPEIAKEIALDSTNPFGREDYLIRSSKKRLLILGATPLAIRRAVADLVHRWGYRQFFPGKSWEIIPKAETLTLQADEVQRPAYHVRDLFTTNFLPGEEEDYKRWLELNRMGKGFQLNTRHAYGGIYKRNRKAFRQNPDYFAFVDGEPQSPAKGHYKFNAANPDLLNLLIADAKNLLNEKGEDSISMDPSDFGGWDNSGVAFETIGKASNQAVTMANVVAKKAAAPLNRYVGMYAYHEHQWAPDIPVEPNIIVSFATRFLKPDQDLNNNIEQWKEKGVAHIGIRDYHSYWNWDLAMPGRALGGNLAYLEQSFTEYFKTGARFYTSETQSAWGAYGLGFYMTTRLLWNPEEDPKAIVADFLEKSFGPAAEPMARFYSRLNGEDSVLARQTTPAEFYAPLMEAMRAAQGREEVQQRIAELLAYVRYVELFSEFEKARTEKRSEALLALCDWVFRVKPMQMLPTKAIALRDKRGIHVVYKNLSIPSLEECESMLEKAAVRPVTREELVKLATASMNRANAAPEPLPLRPASEPTTSPWIRNSAAFVFPMEANSTASAALSMRRFGFSGYPRYVVRDSSGAIIERGRMHGEETLVEINSVEAGDYALVIEPTPNLVKCQSETSFCIVPTRDSGGIDAVSYQGSFYFAIPEGVETQLVVGGQGEREKVRASIHSAQGTLAEGGDINGVEPLVLDLEANPAVATYEVRIRRPKTGYFEDLFFKFNDSYSCPISLKPGMYRQSSGAGD